MNKGFVYLVGAGPGRADLITVRGAEVLKTADCVISDKLANPALLKFARADAEIIHVPKRIGAGSFTQQEINNLLIEKASNGKTVVRLKGGDPCIFGRGAEEAALLAEAGIDFEIVPGVTAAIAAAEYAGVLLTDRKYSSQVVFVTGREADSKVNSNIDWHLLAKFSGTIVFYMAMGSLDFIVEQLIKNGMAEEMPTAVIADATLPTQRTVRTSLRQLSEKCKQEKIEPPAIVVVGVAADSNTKLNWFMKKPLFGRNIVVTRDVPGNAGFAAKIIKHSGNPIEFTTIKLKPLTGSNRFLRALAKIAEYDWIIFTSVNGVTICFDYLQSLEKDGRVFGSAKIAAIGSETASRLDEFGIKADFVPTVFTSNELGKQLIGFANLQGKKILLLRSQLASNELGELLEQAGAKVDDIAVYTAVTEKSECKWLKEKISAGQIDWLTFASPSSVKGFFAQIQSDLVNSSNVKVASIGPVTSEQLKNLGVRVDVTAREHTTDGLLAAIEGTYE
ncbi:Siroheme synthase [subsurface metagenome]